jgi:hypothetical protein
MAGATDKVAQKNGRKAKPVVSKLGKTSERLSLLSMATVDRRYN